VLPTPNIILGHILGGAAVVARSLAGHAHPPLHWQRSGAPLAPAADLQGSSQGRIDMRRWRRQPIIGWQKKQPGFQLDCPLLKS